MTPDLLAAAQPVLSDVEYARAQHVVSENRRVGETVAALEAGDLDTVGRLFAESHASLRDRFEVSSPELDAMVSIATSVPGVIAARMTGAGLRRLHRQSRPSRRRRRASDGRRGALPGDDRPPTHDLRRSTRRTGPAGSPDRK